MFIPRIVKTGVKLALVTGALYLTADLAANKERSTIGQYVNLEQKVDGVVVRDRNGEQIAKYDPSGTKVTDVTRDIDKLTQTYSPQEIEYGMRVIEKRNAYESEKSIR